MLGKASGDDPIARAFRQFAAAVAHGHDRIEHFGRLFLQPNESNAVTPGIDPRLEM